MPNETLKLTTESEQETEALGAALMSLIKDGTLVALHGDLGAGKTCLVRGMATAIGQAQNVSSPTFTIVNEYSGDRKLYHLDLYRISTYRELIDLGFEELFEPVDGITVVEWAERAKGHLPDSRIDVHAEHIAPQSRALTFTIHGAAPENWKQTLEKVLNDHRGSP